LRYLILFFFSSFLLSACCYSFKGVSIPAEINTFYVENFTLRAENAPVELDIIFSQALRNKIRNESKLRQREQDPDVLFSGEITNFYVSAEAPQENNTVALNKLEITVQVVYTNNRNEKENYTQSFSFFKTFPSDQDLQSVQDALIKEIFKTITENIFNKTFTNW
jgi:protease II